MAQNQLDTEALQIATAAKQRIEMHERYSRDRDKELNRDFRAMSVSVKEGLDRVHSRVDNMSSCVNKGMDKVHSRINGIYKVLVIILGTAIVGGAANLVVNQINHKQRLHQLQQGIHYDSQPVQRMDHTASTN